MSTNLTTREQVTVEWAEAVAAALLRSGWAHRAGAGSTIEIQSDRRGWMPLQLPGGSEHFDNKTTRDIAVIAIEDTLRRLRQAEHATALAAEYSRNLSPAADAARA